MAYEERETGNLIGSDKVEGTAVYGADNQRIGSIERVMIDKIGGKVAYAVLGFGGFLGMGDKLFAIPWQALELDTEDHAFILDVDAERLKQAPGFDKDHWPTMADEQWATQIHDYYRATPYWA